MSYQNNKRRKYNKNDLSIKIFDGVIGLFGKLFSLIFQKSKKSFIHGSLNSQIIKEKWLKIDELVKLGGESRFKQTVIEADKLTSHVLKSIGYDGTMAEQLKAAQTKFSWETYQGIWQAHKVRNEIVHNFDKELLEYEATDALEKFKKGLKELGISL